MNKFEFSGTVCEINFIDGKRGRITKLTLENTDGRFPVPVIVDFFDELAGDVEQGKEVLVYGTVTGRLWEDKVFVGLRADTILTKKDDVVVDYAAPEPDLPF